MVEEGFAQKAALLHALAAELAAAVSADMSRAHLPDGSQHHDNQTLSISRTFDGRYRLDAWFDTETGAEIAAAIEECTTKGDPNLSVFEDPIGRRHDIGSLTVRDRIS